MTGKTGFTLLINEILESGRFLLFVQSTVDLINTLGWILAIVSLP
jgi:hypothetical protein